MHMQFWPLLFYSLYRELENTLVLWENMLSSGIFSFILETNEACAVIQVCPETLEKMVPCLTHLMK